jgi:hypothetical protein
MEHDVSPFVFWRTRGLSSPHESQQRSVTCVDRRVHVIYLGKGSNS